MTSIAVAESEETSVSVDVDDTVQLDVKPDNLAYTEVGSGTDSALEPGEQVETSDDGFEHIDIANIGSDRLERIYAEATFNGDNPFGTTPDDDVDHDTGNLVLMSTETAQSYDISDRGGLADVSDPHYLNRVEYFEEESPEYIQTHEEGDEPGFSEDTGESVSMSGEIQDVGVGRFRVGEASYFFTYYETDATDEEVLLVGNTPETPTELGTFNFVEGGEEDFTVIGLESGTATDTHVHQTAFSLVSFDVDSADYDGEALLDGNGGEDSPTDLDTEEREYNFYVDRNDGDELVARTRFNVEFETVNTEEGIVTSGIQQYLLGDVSETEALQPGENFPVDVGVQLPNGIDNQQIESGEVTFNAQAYTDSS